MRKDVAEAAKRNPLAAYLVWFDAAHDHVQSWVAMSAGVFARKLIPSDERWPDPDDLRRAIRRGLEADDDWEIVGLSLYLVAATDFAFTRSSTDADFEERRRWLERAITFANARGSGGMEQTARQALSGSSSCRKPGSARPKTGTQPVTQR